jgi:hypothetical protein
MELNGLSQAEKTELLSLLELKRWRESPWDFIHDACLTMDEADEGKVKHFPEKEYLQRICELSQKEPILCIPKSRRMMMTWVCLAICLWEGMMKDNQMIFIQSKKFDDSCYLLGVQRLMFMYSNLPHERHDFPKLTKKISSEKGYSVLQFSNGTSFFAVAEGADQLRQYTASRVYCTEMAFWDEAELTWMALRPVIQGGGKILIDSSAHPGFFARLVNASINKQDDVKNEDEHEEIQGVHEYRRNGAYIARVHYTADPDKRKPEWKAEQQAGTTTAGWEREYEINWNVSIEEPYYPEFRYETHVAKQPLKPIEGRPLELSFDYGLTPATLICQTTAKGQILVLRELQSFDCGMRNHGNVLMSDLAAFYPKFQRNCIGDPAGNQRSQADEKTANEILRDDFGLYVEPGAISQTERSEAIRWFLTNTTPDGKPMLLVDPSCELLIGGFTGGYHRKKVGDRLLDDPDKNEFSHLMDCMAYVAAKIYGQRTNNQSEKWRRAVKAGRVHKWGGM